MSPLRKTKVYRALHRPHLIMGVERKALLLLGFGSFLIAYVLMSLSGLVLAALVWGIGLILLRAMAKADPDMVEIFRRYTRFRHFYSARTSVHAR